MTTKSKKMIQLYRQMPNIDKNMFFTSYFKTTPEDITNSEFIEYDIERSDEDIAPVLTDISTGAHVVSEDIFTNKKIKPPAFAEQMPFNVFDLTNRMAGETEYEAANVDFQVRLRTKLLRSWEKMTNLIKRTIELQASQVLQTGIVTLPDAANNTRYTLDWKMKATHKPTVSTAWSTTATATPLADLESLMDVIRNDGLVDVEDGIFGITAFKNFLQNADVQLYFKKDQFSLGALNPVMLNSGAKYQGFIHVGNYKLNIWTYNGRYKDLGGTKQKYLADDKVILLPNADDLAFTKAFAAIPIVVDSDPRLRDVLPGRVSIPGAFDFKPRVYTDEKAESMFTEIKSRPILIPKSIDRFGCLDTEP